MGSLSGNKKFRESLLNTKAHFPFFKWRGITHYVALGLSGAMLLSFVVSAISPTLTHAVTAGSGGGATSSVPLIADQARSFTDINGLYDCFTKSSAQMDDSSIGSTRNRISAAHVKSGDWWATTGSINRIQTDGAKTAGSYLNSKTDVDGVTLCNDVLKDALSVWGYKDGLEFMCAIKVAGQNSVGIPRADGSSCQSGAGTDWNLDGYQDDMWATIKKIIYQGNNPDFSATAANVGAATYLVYRNAFLQGCHPVVSSTASSDTIYKDIVIVADDGSKKTQTYEGNTHDTTRDVYRIKGSRNDNETCANIALNVNKYAPQYYEYRLSTPLDKGTQTPPTLDSTNSKLDQKSCGNLVDGVGWMICPIIQGLAGLNDFMWGFVSSLLTINPLDNTSSNGSIYAAWGVLRNLANVAFVIVFLIVIFSQLSSVGVSNYGVKKMVPRLIIGAILVNVSFLIVQVAVDVSNILGSSLYDLIVGLAPPSVPTWDKLLTTISVAAGGTLGIMVGVTIAGGWGAVFWLLLPIVIVSALGLLAAVLTLIFRQAVVPILAILAPLAFIAFLLPNTEALFKKWRGLMLSMLMLYPMAAVLFGGVRFASSILSNGSWFNQLVGLIILTLPLFSLPFLARQGGPLLSKVSGSLSSLAKRAGKPINGVTKSFGDRAKARYDSNPATRRGLKRVRQTFGRNAKLRGLETAAYSAQSEDQFNNNLVEHASDYSEKLPNGSVAQQAFQRNALAISEKMETENVRAAGLRLRSLKLSQASLRELALGTSGTSIDSKLAGTSGDATLRAAAIQSLVANNDIEGMGKLWDDSRSWADDNEGNKLRTTLADSLQSSASRPGFYGMGALQGLRLGTNGTNTETIEEAIRSNAYSPAKIAAADKDELASVAKVAATSTTLTISHKQMLINNAHTATTDPELSRTISKNRDQIENIRTNKAP